MFKFFILILFSLSLFSCVKYTPKLQCKLVKKAQSCTKEVSGLVGLLKSQSTYYYFNPKLNYGDFSEILKCYGKSGITSLLEEAFHNKNKYRYGHKSLTKNLGDDDDEYEKRRIETANDLSDSLKLCESYLKGKDDDEDEDDEGGFFDFFRVSIQKPKTQKPKTQRPKIEITLSTALENFNRCEVEAIEEAIEKIYRQNSCSAILPNSYFDIDSVTN